MDLFQFYPIKGIEQDEHFKRLLYNMSGREKLRLDRTGNTLELYSEYPYYAEQTVTTVYHYMRNCKTGKKGDPKPGNFDVCKDRQSFRFSGDIMNGATLLKYYFDKIVNTNVFFCDFKNNWSSQNDAKVKFKQLYSFLYEEKSVNENYIIELFGEPLYRYVCAVSQLGNFMPCPVGYNRGGRGGFTDRMDSKLDYYYNKYFSSQSDNNEFKTIFKTWEDFVTANFLQMYFEDNDYTKIIPLFALNKAKPRIKDYSEDDWNKYFNKTSELINKRTEIIM